MTRLMRTAEGRLWAEIEVTGADLQRGMNTRLRGPHLFTGMWYGRDARKYASFGKIMSDVRASTAGRTGRTPPPYVARQLGMDATRLSRPAETRIVIS